MSTRSLPVSLVVSLLCTFGTPLASQAPTLPPALAAVPATGSHGSIATAPRASPCTPTTTASAHGIARPPGRRRDSTRADPGAEEPVARVYRTGPIIVISPLFPEPSLTHVNFRMLALSPPAIVPVMTLRWMPLRFWAGGVSMWLM